MLQISLVFLVSSLLVLTVIFYRNRCALYSLKPEECLKPKEGQIEKIKNRIRCCSLRRKISINSILQKILSKARVLVLKIETKIEKILYRLRQKSNNK